MSSVERLQEQLQRLVSDLGRDDIGVGEVRAEGDTLRFTLTSGSHVHPAEMSLRTLATVEQAKAAMAALLVPVSKAIEQHHLDAVGVGADHGDAPRTASKEDRP